MTVWKCPPFDEERDLSIQQTRRQAARLPLNVTVARARRFGLRDFVTDHHSLGFLRPVITVYRIGDREFFCSWHVEKSLKHGR